MGSSGERIITRTVEETSEPPSPRVSSGPPAEVGEAATGTRVGRYVLLDRIGAGGMGVVFAAYDPQLDRKVAVKLLLDRKGRVVGPEERERLVAEAQALARLNHPNVVTVHDVGVDDAARVFVAMEYVRGQTLGAWRKARDRPWREVVAMLVQTGRGLVAAHGQSIVHRDFKPDNVLVEDGPDGRPRVLDFGLALQVGDTDVGANGVESLETSLARWSRQSNDSGRVGITVPGTPAYMAPEQYLKLPGDEGSDQFAFCVTAWELLYGARPFLGDNRIALATAIVTGPVQAPPPDSGVPRFVERALRRGLSKEPGDRWPSVAALLEALADDPIRRRRRRLAWGGIVAVGAAGVWAFGAQPPVDPCAHGGVRLAKVWNAETQAALRASFRATGLAYAETTAASTVEGLSDYAAAWQAEHREACEETHVRHLQSDQRLDARMACLDTRLEALAATATLMTDAPVAIVENAAAAVVGLPSVSTCAEAGRAQGGPVPPPPEIAARVQEIRQRAAELAPLSYAGRAQDARTGLTALLKEAEGLDYEPLRAQMLLRVGHAQSMAGAAADAAASLREAAFCALSSGDDEVQAEAASMLIRVEGIERSNYDLAALWAEHAEAAVARLAEPGRIAAVLEYRQCRVRSDRGDVDGALPHCEAAVRRFTDTVGSAHIDTVSARQGLGIAYYMAGRLDEAEPPFVAALQASRALRGPDHPSHAIALQALAAICYSRGKGAECIPDFEQAYRAAVAGRGARHPSVADYANNLALAYVAAGRIDDAEPRARQAMEIREAAEVDHPGIAASHRILSKVARARGQLDEARQHLDAAVDGAIRTRGRHHPDVVDGLRLRAELSAHRQDLAAAIVDYEAALQAREGIALPPAALAGLQWGLGRTLLANDARTRERAVGLVREAQRGYAPDAEEQAAISAWLEAEARGVEPSPTLTVEQPSSADDSRVAEVGEEARDRG